MHRIHFTAADIAKTRLKTTVGIVAETVFALARLRTAGTAPYARWRHQVTRQLHATPALYRLLHPPQGDGRQLEALLDLVNQAKDGTDFITHTLTSPHRDAASGLAELWQIGVAPYWSRITRHLEADCDARARIVMAGGVEHLLTTLHPRITWRAPVLEIAGSPETDTWLNGRGLVLSPSVFLCREPAQLIGAAQHSAPPALVFAAPPAGVYSSDLWDVPKEYTEALAALVGQTRASALRALRMSCSTTQLADRLGISAAAVSKHTAVLRQTGLITTRRVRNTVLHTVTPLGLALLGSETGR